MVMVLAFLFWEVNAEAWLARGLEALKAGHASEARVALEEAVRQAPGQPVMWLAVAEARLRTGGAAEAVAAMEQAGKLAPESAMVQRGRAMFARRMGETAQGLLDGRQEKKAEGVLREAVKAYPGEAELWRLLGLAIYAQGRNGDAVVAFVRAIDLAPEEEMLFAGLETLLPAGKEVERRLADYTARHAESAMGWYLLGLERGEAALFEKAWALDAKFWPAAFALHRSVAAERAVSLLERVVELNPEFGAAYYALAQFYGKAGQREKASAARKRHHALTGTP